MEENRKLKKPSVFSRIWQTVPLVPKIFYLFATVAAAVHIFACLHVGFADLVHDHISSHFRFILAQITNILPFSLAEMFLLAIPALIAFCVYLAARGGSDFFWRWVATMLSIAALVYALFVFTIGCGYRGSTIDEKLDLPREEVSLSDLNATATWLRDEANALVPEIVFSKDGASIMPYSYEEMNEKLLAAYAKLSERYPFIQKMRTRLKAVSFSEVMSYMHLTGVYTYMTGEANINNDFPDYTIPFTAAHELAHQRGIARENEANFVAFLVCLASEDAYIRYSGYMNLLIYTGNALASADTEAYRELCKHYDPAIAYEFIAYSEFYKKYEDSTLGEISGSINDAYLQIQGTPGTRSYGMVVDLAVSYFRSFRDE